MLAYKIDQIVTVLPFETEYTQIEEGKDYITLVTCTPYGINSHRLLVRGTRVPYKTMDMEHTKPWPVVHKEEDTRVPFRTIVWYSGLAVVSITLVLILFILFVPVFHRKKKNTDQKEDN